LRPWPGATGQHIDGADHAAFALVAAKQRGLVDGEAGQAMPAGQRRAVGIAPRGAVAHLDFLHGIDRPLAQHQMQAHPVAVADGLLFAAATHQSCSCRIVRA
jgi:hypothetical protein